MSLSVAVITPTIGSKAFKKALECVQSQTYKNIVHYIFLDGIENGEKSELMIGEKKENQKLIKIEKNIGGGGWYSNLTYSAAPFFVKEDLIAYLDEDDWGEDNHIETLVEVIERGNDGAFSLRKIYSESGDFICEDNCESLGKGPIFNSEDRFLVGTNSLLVKRNLIIRISYFGYGGGGTDRVFLKYLKKESSNFDTSYKYTSIYRLGGKAGATKEFFLLGNEIQKRRYNNKLPGKDNI